MLSHTALFEDHPIRRTYDAATETWWFSVVDIVQVLTQQSDSLTARKYWNKLKPGAPPIARPLARWVGSLLPQAVAKPEGRND